MSPQYRPPLVVPSLPPGGAAKLIRFAEQAGIVLQPWQVKLIEAMEESPSPADDGVTIRAGVWLPGETETSPEGEDPAVTGLRSHVDGELCKLTLPDEPHQWTPTAIGPPIIPPGCVDEIMVYRSMDPEAWCPNCQVHWAVLMDVFYIILDGVTCRGKWLRCFVCGIWEQV